MWVKILRSKYKCGDSLIPYVHKTRQSSNAWRGITHVWPIFKRNLIWRVGNRHSVSFWQNHWIPGVINLVDFA